jgi:DNA-binding Lrp family transcriptional regulator
VVVFIGLRVDRHSRPASVEIEQALLAIPAVVACYLITGTADFMVEVAVPDLPSYERMLLDEVLAIPGVVEARSTFTIRTIRSQAGRLTAAVAVDPARVRFVAASGSGWLLGFMLLDYALGSS